MRKKLFSFVTVVMAFITVMLPLAVPASAAYYNTYGTVKSISDVNSCPSMQGIAVGSTYVYTAKVNSGNTKAVIYKTNKNTGESTLLTDSVSGKTYAQFHDALIDAEKAMKENVKEAIKIFSNQFLQTS